MKFPQLHTRDLDGHDRRVPDELEGRLRVVIVAFQRWQTAQVDTWWPVLRSLQTSLPELTVWEIPALSRVYLPGRFYIDGGMRLGIVDPDARRHTLTAYTDIGALTTSLGIPSVAEIHLFALDPAGEVLWRASGELQQESAARLVELADARLGSRAEPEEL